MLFLIRVYIVKRIFCIIIVAISMFTIAYAHSGRTDSNGGHYDRSTGEYHYHHGYSAHQHNADGSCPYEVEVETETEPETTQELLVVDSSEKNNEINKLNEKITTLEEQIDAKQQTIGKLNNELDEKFNEIEHLKYDKNTLHFIYWFIIICMGVAIWKLKK